MKFFLPRFCYLLIALWVIGYFYFLNLFSLNVPYGDDLELFLHFWMKYEKATSISEKIAILFDQFVEHRLMFTRLVFLVLVKLGIANIKLVVLIGNSFLIVLLWIFHSILIKHYKLPIYSLLPVTFLIFQPCYSFDGMIWAAATLAYIPVSTLSILTIYLLWKKSSQAFWLSIFTGFITVYTFGNGQFILIVAAFFLVTQQRWKDLTIWIAFTVLTLSSYYYHYEIQYGRPNIFLNILNHPSYILINIFVFLGGLLEQEENLTQLFSVNNVLSTFIGFVVIVTFLVMLYLWFKSFFQIYKSKYGSDMLAGKAPNPSSFFWLSAILFFIISAAIFSISRTSTDAVYAHINRYRIHSVCAVILSYGFIIVLLKPKQRTYFLQFSIIISLLFSISSYYFFYYWLSDNTRTLQTGLHNWHHEKQWMIYRETAYWENASKAISSEFEKDYSNVYKFPNSIFEKIDSASTVQDIKIGTIQNKDARLISFSNVSLSGNFQTPTDGIYITFKSKARTYIFNTHLVRTGLKQFILHKDYYRKGFFLELNTIKILMDKYEVGIILRENDKNTFFKTGQGIDFNAPFSQIAYSSLN